MTQAERERLLKLIDWRPAQGVISAYFNVDHADRGGGWRVGLKDGLRDLEEPEDHDGRVALRETVKRMLERFDSDDEPPPGRAQVGFVEVARKEGTEDLTSLQLSSREDLVVHGRRPAVRPLVDLLERGRPRPVIAVSAERIRGWMWSRGHLVAAEGWDDELAIYDGRERKGAMPQDPARGQAVSSSGRDQYGQKLEDNRKRFLHDAAKRISGDDRARGAEMVVIGEAPYLGEFCSALDAATTVDRIEGPDVISEPDGAILERIAPEIESWIARREEELAGRALDSALASEGRGAVGLDEVSAALVEERVDRLVLEYSRSFGVDELSETARDVAQRDGHLDVSELLIGLALRSSADVTLVADAAAEKLSEHGGIAAQLRY